MTNTVDASDIKMTNENSNNCHSHSYSHSSSSNILDELKCGELTTENPKLIRCLQGTIQGF